MPIGNRLAKKLGSKPLVIGGGFTTFLCFVGACLASNIAQFSVFVIIWGVGVAVSYGPMIIAVLPYFPSKSAFAISLIGLGSGFGIMVYPPLTEFCVEVYGWRGTLLLFSAVNAQVCVFGAFIKPAPSSYAALASEDGSLRESASPNNDGNKLWKYWKVVFKGICQLLALDVLWYEPKFVIHAFVSSLIGVTYSAWMIYLVPHGVARGIDRHRAAFLSSAGGLGTVLGRVIQAVVMHLRCITAVQLDIFLAFISLFAFVLDPLVSGNYPGLLCLALVNGLCIPTMAVLFLLVAQEVLSEDLSVQGWGTLNLFFGVGELAGGGFAGIAYDATGSYDTSFLMLGGLSGVIFAVLFTERLLRLCRHG
ncbi:monocarboxylate transporter 12-like isoform X2 [Acanthaster planci]|nr:monocarboxylate transporter 12-like isoform X2 [Acanthaster planci]